MRLDALRDRKQGKNTNATVVQTLHEMLDADTVESVVVVVLKKDSNIDVHWTTNTVEATGLLATGQHVIQAVMRE